MNSPSLPVFHVVKWGRLVVVALLWIAGPCAFTLVMPSHKQAQMHLEVAESLRNLTTQEITAIEANIAAYRHGSDPGGPPIHPEEAVGNGTEEVAACYVLYGCCFLPIVAGLLILCLHVRI